MKTNWTKCNGKNAPDRNVPHLVTDGNGAVGIGQHIGNQTWACAHAGSHVVAFAPLPEGFKDVPGETPTTAAGTAALPTKEKGK